MNLFFDTETSGLPKFKSPNTDPSQPWIVQLAAIVSDESRVYMAMNFVIESRGRTIEPKAYEAHKITTEVADAIGFPEESAFYTFIDMVTACDKLICHNTAFDMRLLEILSHRVNDYETFVKEVRSKPNICTMIKSTNFCKLPYPSGRKGNKWPKLEELHRILFNEDFEGAHDALNDVYATQRCYYELVQRGVIDE